MYKCENCKAIKENNADVYYVESAFLFAVIPTCSKECAENIKDREIKLLEEKIQSIKNSGRKNDI